MKIKFTINGDFSKWNIKQEKNMNALKIRFGDLMTPFAKDLAKESKIGNVVGNDYIFKVQDFPKLYTWTEKNKAELRKREKGFMFIGLIRDIRLQADATFIKIEYDEDEQDVITMLYLVYLDSKRVSLLDFAMGMNVLALQTELSKFNKDQYKRNKKVYKSIMDKFLKLN